jgi:ribulose-phosphate 3-epimerase
MDGDLAPTKSPSVAQIWLPEGVKSDIHIMYRKPAEVLGRLIELKPHMVVFHAEADGMFEEIAERLKSQDIKVGVALLPQTEVSLIEPAMNLIDHVLIFSGDLGHFGGTANLSLLGKASELKALKPRLEIGWDGGINQENALTLINNGIDVLNTGGFIQRASDPATAYATLIEIAENKDHEKANII